MKKFAIIAIATIIGIQAIFWVAVILKSDVSPQVTQDSEPTAPDAFLAGERV